MTSMNDAEQVNKHTPGAWVAEGSMVRGGEGIYLDDPIASVYDPNDQHHLTPTTKANARLIAAAPELLAALEAWAELDAAHANGMRQDEYDHEYKRLTQTSVRVIAKARGVA